MDIDPPIAEIPPSLGEVREAMVRLRGAKAAGVFNINVDLLKASSAAVMGKLHAVLAVIWELDTIPPDWKRGLVFPIWKMVGDHHEHNNYHSFILLSV